MLFRKRYLIKSSSDPDKYYVVLARGVGNTVLFGCTCPDWIYRKNGQREACKHIDAVISRKYPQMKQPKNPFVPVLV